MDALGDRERSGSDGAFWGDVSLEKNARSADECGGQVASMGGDS